jgi:hypothetical protein
VGGRRRIGCAVLATLVLISGVWWAAADEDATTVRVGGDVPALAEGQSGSGAAAREAADDPLGGPPPAADGAADGRNGPATSEGDRPGNDGEVIAAGRRPPTTTTTGRPGTPPSTDPDFPSASTTTTFPPPPGNGDRRPDPPGNGNPPTTGPPTTTTTARPGPDPDPRHERLVYIRESLANPSDADLFIGDLEGRHEIRLTSGPDRDQFPAWSPDGSTIAFNRITGGGSDELWSIRADGTGLRQLTFSGAGAKREPVWSPDGRFLAFTAAYFNPTRVWLEILDLASGGMTKISQGPMDGQPVWSPDGKTIVYTARSINGEDDDLFSVKPDGSDRRGLTSAPFDHSHESYRAFGWSADGSRLLVYNQRPAEGFIIRLRADGSDRRQILSDRATPPGGAHGAGTLGFLTWSPDEQMIVFNGYNGLYAVDTDGSGHRRLDPPDVARHMADWQPR